MDSLANAMNPVTEPFELAAVWINRVRYAKGGYIKLYKGSLSNEYDQPTHRITKVSGLLNDSKHWVELKDLDNGELLTIEI